MTAMMKMTAIYFAACSAEWCDDDEDDWDVDWDDDEDDYDGVGNDDDLLCSLLSSVVVEGRCETTNSALQDRPVE